MYNIFYIIFKKNTTKNKKVKNIYLNIKIGYSKKFKIKAIKNNILNRKKSMK